MVEKTAALDASGLMSGTGCVASGSRVEARAIVAAATGARVNGDPVVLRLRTAREIGGSEAGVSVPTSTSQADCAAGSH